MAELSAEAGPSPSCEAVLVQIEHWANRSLPHIAAIIPTSINPHFLFICTWYKLQRYNRKPALMFILILKIMQWSKEGVSLKK